MTVFNTSYTTIDEAFGFLNPELQQKPQKMKKKNKDPLCELYNQRWQQQPYTDTDLVTYANQYRYNKTDFQNQTVNGRENKSKYVDLSEGVRQEYESNYDFQPSKMIEQESYNTKQESYHPTQESYHSSQESYHPTQESYHPTQESYVPTEQEKYRNVFDEDAMVRALAKKYMTEQNEDKGHSLNYIDLILYIISGIMLIFMMEQFVRIGIYMQGL
jgi:hypothetical protein